MVLRSDEAANQAEIERDKRFRSNVGKGVAAATTLAGAGLSAGMASRIAPFLSKYVPVDLAIKGISKVNPRMGEFLKKGQQMGLDVQEGMNFIKEKLQPTQQPAQPQQQQPKDNRNIIEQYSPGLHKYIADKVSAGEDPIRAAALALFEKGNPYENDIRKIEKDHKVNWSQLVQSIYGSGQYGGAVNPPNQPQQQTQQPAQQAQQGQAGPGQQALMDILTKINQKLGQ